MADDVADLVDLFVVRVQRYQDAMAKRLVRAALEEADAQLASEEGRRARPRRAPRRRPALEERRPPRKASVGAVSVEALRERAAARAAALGLVPKPARKAAQPRAVAGATSPYPAQGDPQPSLWHRGDDPWPETAVLRELVGRPRAPGADGVSDAPATATSGPDLAENDRKIQIGSRKIQIGSAAPAVVPVPPAVDAAAPPLPPRGSMGEAAVTPPALESEPAVPPGARASGGGAAPAGLEGDPGVALLGAATAVAGVAAAPPLITVGPTEPPPAKRQPRTTRAGGRPGGTMAVDFTAEEIARLPALRRQVAEAMLEGLDGAAIAARLGMSRDSVYQHGSQARATVRRYREEAKKLAARPAAHDDASAAAAAGTGATPPAIEPAGSLSVVAWDGKERAFTSPEEAETFAATRASTPATPPPPVLIGPGNGARAAAIANRSGAHNDVMPALELVPAAPVEVSRPAPAPADAPFEFPRDQLDRLKPAMRRVVELRLDGLEVREIGARLGLSLNHVHHMLKDARGLPKNELHAAYLVRATRVVAERERAMEGEVDPAADRPARAPRACKICRKPGHNAVTCSQRLRGLARLMAIELAADRLYGRDPPPVPTPPVSVGPQLDEAAAGVADASRTAPSRAADDDTDFSEFLPSEEPALAAPVDAFAVEGASPWDPGEAPAAANDLASPTMERARRLMADREHPDREKSSRGVTIPATHLTREERRVGALVVYPDVDRPATRGDCRDMPRPCPFTSCSHHLYLDVGADGALKLNHPEREVWELTETCSLDVADRGGVTLEEAGAFLGITRERIRQVEEMAVERGRRWLERMERATSAKIRQARASG